MSNARIAWEVLHALAIFLRNTMRAAADVGRGQNGATLRCIRNASEDEVTVGSPIARPSDKSKRGLRRPAALKTHKPSSGVAF